jgi:hypothetical protein
MGAERVESRGLDLTYLKHSKVAKSCQLPIFLTFSNGHEYVRIAAFI